MSDSLKEDTLAYLSDYRDTIDVLPMELRRNFALIRQLDEGAQDLMKRVAEDSTAFCNGQETIPAAVRKRRLLEISTLLNESIKRGEEKFALAKSTYDAVDRHCTRLDNDLNKYEDEQLIGPSRTGRTPAGVKAQQPSTVPLKTSPDSSAPIKKRGGRKRKRETDQDEQGDSISREDALRNAQTAISFSKMPIDPNEPVYCKCRVVSYGEMVACDNEDCEIEWFHLECVGLKTPPKGKWYCDNCIEIKNKKKL